MSKIHFKLKDLLSGKFLNICSKKDSLESDIEIMLPEKSGELILKDTYVILKDGTIDLSKGNLFSITVSTGITFNVINIDAAGTVSSFILELTNPGTNVSFFNGIKWDGGVIPTLSATGTDILGFYTYDSGVTWRGLILSKDSK